MDDRNQKKMTKKGADPFERQIRKIPKCTYKRVEEGAYIGFNRFLDYSVATTYVHLSI